MPKAQHKSVSAKETQRLKRKVRIRQRIHGSTARPRLSVYRSGKHIYAQVIDDTTGNTLVSASTVAKGLKGEAKDLKPLDAAKRIGEAIADACKAKSITQVVFDRNGYLYHGRVKTLADAARERGLSF